MNREKHAFFTAVQRMEKESKERRTMDREHNKKILLRSMTNGFGRNAKNRKAQVTLPKLSIQEDKE